MKLITVKFSEDVLRTVTKEKNVFDYIKKVKNHFGRAKIELLKTIPDIKDRLIFADDYKSVQYDTDLIGEIETAYSEATGIDKAHVSKAKNSFANSLNGRVENNPDW